MVEQVIISTQVDTSQAEGQYIGLRKEIALLKKQLDVLEEGTEEYNRTFSKLSIKMQEQKERMTALRNSGADLGVMLGNVSKISGTIVQGFAGATAALSLFGIENENLIRTIQKVQAFESIARTLESFEDAPKRIKALFQNIKGIAGQSSSTVTLDVQKQTTASIDAEPFKEAADSTDRMQKASLLTSGSMANSAAASNQTAAAQVISTGESTKQLPLQERLLTIEEIKAAYSVAALEKKKATIRMDELLIEMEENYEKQVEARNTAASNGMVADEQFYIDKKAAQDAEYKRLSDTVDLENKKIKGLREEVAKNNLVAESVSETNAEVDKGTQATEKSAKASKGLASVWSNMKSILTGVGIGLIFAAIIFAVTKLIDHFKKMNDQIKKTFKEAAEFNKEYSEALTKSIEKELGMLKVLDAGYKNLGKNKEKQSKYLTENKEKYKEVGVEVDKIIKGEITYNEAILKANESLTTRAKLLGITSLLVEKYSKQLDLQTQQSLNAQSIINLTPFNFAFVRSTISDINEQVSNLIVEGYGNVDSILNRLKSDNLTAWNKLTSDQISQLKSGIKTLLKVIPDEFQETTKKQGDELRNVNKEINKLEKDVTGYYEASTKGGTTQTTNLKTYNEIVGQLIDKQKDVKLNNPFTPEEVRKNELFFEQEKKRIDELILLLLQTPGDYSKIIEDLKIYRIQLLETEDVFNKKSRDIKIKDAIWNRDNTLRERADQLLKDKEHYKNILDTAKESLKNGVISSDEYKKIEDEVRKGSETSIIEFTNGLQSKLKAGEISYEEFRKRLNEFADTDLSVFDPSVVDTGKVTKENYNFLQDLLKEWDAYYKTLQDADFNYVEQSKKTNEQIYTEKMAAIEELTNDIIRQTEMSNSKISTKINDRNSKSWLVGFSGIRSGYKDFLDELDKLQNELDLNKGLQNGSSKRIELMKNELNNENITTEKRIELLKSIEIEEQNLTNLKEEESQKRLSMAEKEQAIIDETVAGTLQGIQDVGTVINSVYDMREQTELKRLNQLYKAKLLTEEEYNTQSDAVALEYSKKRQKLEIFTGTMAAVGSSIGAFQSAVNSGIPYPYNLILAGVSSAAAFASVLASVSQLKAMSIDNTSNVNPVSSQTGSSLNYSLNEQTSTSERLLNSLKDQKVYILATEMTDTQDKLAKIESMNSF